MGTKIRLDKYLADMKAGTRREVKELLKKGKVSLDNEVVYKGDVKIEAGINQVVLEGNIISYLTYEYLMLNKPAGVITATKDPLNQTVMDLIPDAKRKDLFPVGRLDKDTEGLLFITNDGKLAHGLLSPVKKIDKVYYAEIEGKVTKDDTEAFLKGVLIEKEVLTRPAKLKILESGKISRIELTIHEGKFHQVKRMFEAVDKKVLYLKRLSMGGIPIDETLSIGGYRNLTESEIEILKTYR